MAKSDSFLKNNVFSIIALCITIVGFIAGYVRLQVTVEALQKKTTDKEIIRVISKQIFKEYIIPTNKDIEYIKTDIKRNRKGINDLYKVKSSGRTMIFRAKSLKTK